jgi:hypothetical protein
MMSAVSETNKRYTDQQLLFLDYLGSEAAGSIDTAMEMAGYAKGYKQHLIKLLKSEIVEVAGGVVAGDSVKAANALVNILSDPTKPGTDNILKAAKEILDRAGIVRPEQDLNMKIPQGGLFILPAKGTVIRQERVINHEEIEDATLIGQEDE